MILARTEQALKTAYRELEKEAKKAGLIVNDKKTKYMLNTRNIRREQNNIQIDNHTIEEVSEFKYLGSTITNNNETSEEIKTRIAAGNKSFYVLKNIFQSRNTSRNIKKRIYKTIIKPVVTYGSETWILKMEDQENLCIFERKILRRIYGPIKEGEEWRTRMNYELKNLYKDPDIISTIKTQRIKWLGHLIRMRNDRGPKMAYERKPEGRRKRGRPRKRWSEDVENDLKQLGVRTWRRKALDREEWKEVIEQAKDLQGP